MQAIMNLKLLKSANNGSSRMPYDGILGKDDYILITFCHGDEDGFMDIQVNNDFISTTPRRLRNDISNYLNFNIPKEKNIIINPCYPYYVRKRYGKSLKDNKVTVIGRWKNETSNYYSDSRGIVYNNFNKKDETGIHILITENEEVPPEIEDDDNKLIKLFTP